MTLPPLIHRAWKTERLAHAYLLYGRDPTRYESTVIELFQTLLCEDPGEEGPCGVCSECRLVTARTHPDMVILMESRSQGQVGVQEVREQVVEPASLTPARAERKLFWLHDVGRFTLEATNTLLKVLEEPPGSALFILTSRTRREVLPTVRSRCQWVRMTSPTQPAESVLERARQLFPEDSLSEQDLRDWLDLLAGRRRTRELSWSRDRARQFFGVLLILLQRMYSEGSMASWIEQHPALDRISYRVLPEILERIEEMDRYGNPTSAVNALLEECYYPNEAYQWPDVI